MKKITFKKVTDWWKVWYYDFLLCFLLCLVPCIVVGMFNEDYCRNMVILSLAFSMGFATAMLLNED